MAKILIPAIAGGAALVLVGVAAATTAFATDDVSLSVDGQVSNLTVRDNTVGDVLKGQGIELGTHDVVLPAADTKITDGLAISVSYGRALDLTVDGAKRTVWTTARSVGEALSQLQLNEADSKLSATRSAGIGRQGLDLEISTAKDITLKADGAKASVRAAGTVADLLDQEGIKTDSNDVVKPSVETELADDMVVTVVDVKVEKTDKKVRLDYPTKKIENPKLAKGTSKVKTKGVAGSATVTVKKTFNDGSLVSSKQIDKTITKRPVTEVVEVGTKKVAATGADLTPANGASCRASFYGSGQVTANGERFNPGALTAANKTLPFNTLVKVTNQANGKSVVVRINDRGPYVSGRCIDLSTAAMSAVGGISSGVITIKYEVVS